jgi:hypothetical protein
MYLSCPYVRISISLHVHMDLWPPVCKSIRLSAHLRTYQLVSVFICLHDQLSVSFHLVVCLHVHISRGQSVFFHVKFLLACKAWFWTVFMKRLVDQNKASLLLEIFQFSQHNSTQHNGNQSRWQGLLRLVSQ